jgi:hypothetical protein
MLKKIIAITIIPTLCLLTACSSGGGSTGSASLPVTTTPPPVNYDTAEYRQNWGLDAISAISAYQAGYTGRGVKVAVIDTGVDMNNPELKPNLDPASTNIISNNPANLQDTDGHGTAVSGVIAAVHNGTGTEGVAFNATLLVVGAADEPTCGSNCSFYQSDLAVALDYARSHGAKIANFSMGGPAVGIELADAMQRAVNAGMILVIAAGNDAAANPSDFAQIAGAGWANGQIIIAGATDQQNLLASFSDKAGDFYKNFFVVAPGDRIVTTKLGGGLSLVSGTSFSAPAVAGAMAVLLQEFPNLSAQAAVNILLTSATDLGAAGVDNVFGYGLINLARAIQPIGTASVPTTSGNVTTASVTGGTLSTSAIHLSAAFGDALAASKALSGAMILDSYQRSFRMDLTQHIRRDQTLPDLAALTEPGQKSFARDLSPRAGMHFEFSAEQRTAFSDIDQRYFANADPRSLHRPDLRWRFTQALGKKLSLTAASHMALTDGVTDETAGLFLNRPENQDIATARPDDLSMGFINRLGPDTTLAMTAAYSRQHDDLYQMDGKQSSVAAQMRHSLGTHFILSLDLGMMREKGAVLGALSGGAMTIGNGATTNYLGLAADWRILPHLSLFGAYMSGRTQVDTAPNSLFTHVSSLATRSLRAGFAGSALFAKADRFGFTVSEPLRVTGGQADVLMATARDYQNNRLTLSPVETSLAPSGHEVDLEISYQTTLAQGLWIGTNIIHQIEAGNVAGGPSQTLAILRMSAGF